MYEAHTSLSCNFRKFSRNSENNLYFAVFTFKYHQVKPFMTS